VFFLFFSAVDIISAIEFNKTGHHLATGDRGGRVVLFEITDAKDVCT
jgi:serine/threonine-protein phosphatase 2A regulatory subunit B